MLVVTDSVFYTVADLPSYSRPNFPSPSGNTSGTGGSTLGYSRGTNQKAPKGPGSPHSPGQGDGLNIRANPLAAFDTRDVSHCIVKRSSSYHIGSNYNVH